jgi:hypothetical protein
MKTSVVMQIRTLLNLHPEGAGRLWTALQDRRIQGDLPYLSTTAVEEMHGAGHPQVGKPCGCLIAHVRNLVVNEDILSRQGARMIYNETVREVARELFGEEVEWFLPGVHLLDMEAATLDVMVDDPAPEIEAVLVEWLEDYLELPKDLATLTEDTINQAVAKEET